MSSPRNGKTKSQPLSLPKYNDGMAAALLAAREVVMAPIRPILRSHNLTEQQWRLLRVLMDDGPMEISQASEVSMIMPPSVSRILKELTGRKLIKRTVDRADARRSILSITKSGERLVHRTAQETARLLSSYRSEFGIDRFDNLINELRAFRTAIKGVTQERKPGSD